MLTTPATSPRVELGLVPLPLRAIRPARSRHLVGFRVVAWEYVLDDKQSVVLAQRHQHTGPRCGRMRQGWDFSGLRLEKYRVDDGRAWRRCRGLLVDDDGDATLPIHGGTEFQKKYSKDGS